MAGFVPKTGVLVSLVSSAIMGVLPSPPAMFRAFNAELETRLIIGLMPDVLSVLLLETFESLVIGVGGIERESSVRVKAWSTTVRKPWSAGAGVSCGQARGKKSLPKPDTLST